MNNIINLQRTGLLLKRFFIENKQREMIFWAITTLIFAIMPNIQSVQIYIFVAGLIFAARQFKTFSYTSNGMHYLLIPATHTEKTTVSVLLSVFYFFVMSMITFALGMLLKYLIFDVIINDYILNYYNYFLETSKMNDFSVIGFLKYFSHSFIKFISIQSIFLLGSIYFKKNAIAKTFLILFALTIIISIFELVFIKNFVSNKPMGIKMLSLFINGDKSLLSYVFEISKYVLPVFLWVISYFRLTEKQV